MELDLTDQEIIDRLGKSKDCGAAGNCLFYSVEHLISSSPGLFEVGELTRTY
jgi:hypothetical protein